VGEFRPSIHQRRQLFRAHQSRYERLEIFASRLQSNHRRLETIPMFPSRRLNLRGGNRLNERREHSFAITKPFRSFFADSTRLFIVGNIEWVGHDTKFITQSEPGMFRRIVVAVLVLAIGITVIFLRKPPTEQVSSPPASLPDRVPALRAAVAAQAKEAAQTVSSYRPFSNARIDDLQAPVNELLRGLPGVVEVEAKVRAENPTTRIIHLRDWHFVPRDLYAVDLRQAVGRKLSPEEIDRLHQELRLEVEIVQSEQLAILRCLIKHHGLKRLYAEGLTAEGLPVYQEKIAVLRDMEREQIPSLRKQLAEVQELIRGMEQAGRANTERHEAAKEIERKIQTMLGEHKNRLVEMGAAGRLLIAGEIDEVLPLDDANLLDAANPVRPDGSVQPDPERVRTREDAQVKAILRRGGVAVIVLGGAHDLSASVRSARPERSEYLRVTTKRFREIAVGKN